MSVPPSGIPDSFVNKPGNYPQDLPDHEIRKRFLNLLGDVETPSVPLNLRITDEVELPGGIIQQRAEYAVDFQDIVPAYHLFRKGLPAEAPGILSIHGHGGEEIFPVGKAYHCRPDPKDPRQYTYQAACAGFRVLAPDALGFGERQTRWGYSRFFFDEIVLHAELTGRGRSLCWKSVWDNCRAVEALEHLGASVIGSLGHSGGSTQNYVLAAVNPKVRAAVCLSSFMTLRHQFYQYRLCHCLYHYIPGMIQAGIDWDQVVALTVPRKLFFYRGGRDEGTPEPMCRAFVEAIRRRCREKGYPESVVVVEEMEAGHAFSMPILSRALAFLKENMSKL